MTLKTMAPITDEALSNLKLLAEVADPFSDKDDLPYDPPPPEAIERSKANGKFFIAAFQAMPAIIEELIQFRNELRPEVRKFALIMENKLRQNDYKGGWSDCSNEYFIQRLTEEFAELQKALLYRGTLPDNIASEAADVANFAMMIANNARII